jgi:hypothetical protein
VKLSDKIISAAIRYQAACSKLAVTAGYNPDLDTACRDAFNELCSAALMADELADIIGQHASGTTIHMSGQVREGPQ